MLFVSSHLNLTKAYDKSNEFPNFKLLKIINQKKMGCANSTCMGNTQSEIEIRQKNGLTLTQELNGRRFDLKTTQPCPFIKDCCFEQSDRGKLNVMRERPTTEEGRIQVLL